MDPGLFLVFFLLAVIYGIVFLLAIVRIWKIYRLPGKWIHSKFFYLSILISLLARTTFFIIFMFQGSLDDDITFLFLYLPTCLFITTELILYWIMVTIYYFAHLHGQDATQSVAIIESEQLIQGKFGKVIVSVIAAWLALQVVMFLLMITNVIPESTVTIEITVVSFVVPVFAIGTALYLHIRYAGIPTRSTLWRKKLLRIVVVVLIWCLSRLINVIINVAVYDPTRAAQAVGHYSPSDDQVGAMIQIFFMILTEIF